MCRGSASASASSVVSEADTDSLGCSWLFFSLWERRNQKLHSHPPTERPQEWAGQAAASAASSLLERCLRQRHGERGVLAEHTNGS